MSANNQGFQYKRTTGERLRDALRTARNFVNSAPALEIFRTDPQNPIAIQHLAKSGSLVQISKALANAANYTGPYRESIGLSTDRFWNQKVLVAGFLRAAKTLFAQVNFGHDELTSSPRANTRLDAIAQARKEILDACMMVLAEHKLLSPELEYEIAYLARRVAQSFEAQIITKKLKFRENKELFSAASLVVPNQQRINYLDLENGGYIDPI